ncbi:hypothetical protein TBLA_0E00580 [Henningerozyma blattae CBS 6284]|uniref:Peptidase S54 rhomboid domain-containing protein n=1 Tax=Henningerozyma blattae (strain ATCC 34711 / CBS 6284 / DSM 70876 / NBRC 10599 / NRRL Y-10934 / UCD 77-7) TaxID=1071380 RepID=I2H417_HENB6|nr:hypothetical protein TBLA_0E00580 [Tetrapisispora blattae CBS 6284]CCH61119.1 hypothetical protein TBLA_0E00580 [Tetrapisispora blattae CBS 6284]
MLNRLPGLGFTPINATLRTLHFIGGKSQSRILNYRSKTSLHIFPTPKDKRSTKIGSQISIINQVNTIKILSKNKLLQHIKFCRNFGHGFNDRYIRLNRFQQFQRTSMNSNSNSIGKITILGLGLMIGIYFGSPFLFNNVPPFTYFRTRPRELVYTLLGINCAIFGLWHVPRCWKFLQKYMLLQKTNIQSKWSIIGSSFSHQEFWHLGFNMLALWSFGISLANMLGVSNFFSLYMNSAIAGSLFSLWYPRIARLALMGPSLGASGALFGVLGCFSYLFPSAKILLFVFPIPGGAWVAFLASMVWNAAGCGLRWGSLDYAAHLGGSLIGIAYGWSISKTMKKQRAERIERYSRWF